MRSVTAGTLVCRRPDLALSLGFSAEVLRGVAPGDRSHEFVPSSPRACTWAALLTLPLCGGICFLPSDTAHGPTG